MRENVFKLSVALTAIVFILLFSILVIPPLLVNPDIIGAFQAGFVNPFSSGYSIDVICCWFILLFWILYEAPKVKYGWVCLVIGLIPGVAFGFAVYLLLRTSQFRKHEIS